MGAGAAFLSVLALGLLPSGASWAEDTTRFVPMQQFVVTPNSPPPPLDRSANSYARCAGVYGYAAQADADNGYAREAETILMAKAIEVGGEAKAEALRSMRDHERALSKQRRQQSEALRRRIYAMEDKEQASMSAKKKQEMMLPLQNEVVFLVRCGLLIQDLNKAGGKP